MSSQTPSSLSNFIDLIFPGKIKEPTEKLLLIGHWSIIKMGYHMVAGLARPGGLGGCNAPPMIGNFSILTFFY